MRIKITADNEKMERKLQNLVVKQLNFAAAVAATKTAVVVRDDYVLRQYRRNFNARNKAFEKIVHNIAAADTRFAKQHGYAVAAIKRKDGPKVQGTTRRPEKSGKGPASTEFMRRHLTGGVKTPIGGSSVAVPLTDSPITRRKSGPKAGAVNKTYEPKTIMTSGKGFVLEGKKGKFIARRMSRGGLQVMYSLKKSTNIRKRYNPMHPAKEGVMMHFPRLFRREFIKAVKTARLRA
jgi:hypothetical protein